MPVELVKDEKRWSLVLAGVVDLFDVTALQLIRSHLSQTGAHHEAIATLALAAK